MPSLNPIHHSIRKRACGKRPPHELTRIQLPEATRELIETECLDIYARMINAGSSLHDTLIAVYLSGMSAASAAMKGE